MVTFFFQLTSSLGGNSRDPDRVWWPDQCQEIRVNVPVRNFFATELPADHLDADLEFAAEAVCVAEYKRTRDSSRDRMCDGDTLTVYVSRSRDVPGNAFRVRLDLDPSAYAKPHDKAKPARLPTADEVAEIEAA